MAIGWSRVLYHGHNSGPGLELLTFIEDIERRFDDGFKRMGLFLFGLKSFRETKDGTSPTSNLSHEHVHQL